MKTFRIFFRTAALVCLLLVLPLVLGAKSWYVKPDAPSGAMGSSWANACTLGDALAENKTQPGDTIYLQVGTYYPSGNGHYRIEHDLTLIGGMNNTQSPARDSTVLDGLDGHRFFYISGLLGTAVHLQNMILRNCNASNAGEPSEYGYGGAIYNKSILTLSDVIIHSCVATRTPGVSGYGGAVFSAGGKVYLLGKTLLYNNIASAGGSGYGGAIAGGNNSKIEIRNNVEIYRNRASTAPAATEALGGAFYLYGTVPCTLHLYRVKIYHNYALDITGSSTGTTTEAGAIYCAGTNTIEFEHDADSVLIYNNEAVSQGTNPTGMRAIYPSGLTQTVYLPKRLEVPVDKNKNYGSATINIDLGDREFGYYEVQNGRHIYVDLSMEKPFDYIFPYIEENNSTTDISHAPDKKKFRLKISVKKDILNLDQEIKFRYCVLKLPAVIGNSLWLHKGVAYSPLSNFLASPGNNFRDPKAVNNDAIRLVSYPPIHPFATPVMQYTKGGSGVKLSAVKSFTDGDSTLWYFPLTQVENVSVGEEIVFQCFPYDPDATAVVSFEPIRIQGLFYKSNVENNKDRKKDTIIAGAGQKLSFTIESDYEFETPFLVKRNEEDLNPKEQKGGKTFTYEFEVPARERVCHIDPNKQSEMTTIDLSAFAPSIPGNTVAEYYGITSELRRRSYTGYYLGTDQSEAYYDTAYGIWKQYGTATDTLTLYYPRARLFEQPFTETFAILVDEPAAHIPLNFDFDTDNGVFTCTGTEDVIGEDGAPKAVRYFFTFRPGSLGGSKYVFTPKFAYDLIFLPETLPSGLVYTDGRLVSNGVCRVPLKQQGPDTLRVYPVSSYTSKVPQTFDPPSTVTLTYYVKGSGQTLGQTLSIDIDYLEQENLFGIPVPAGSFPDRGASPPPESPKRLSDVQTVGNTNRRTFSVGPMSDHFSFETEGLSPRSTYYFQGLLGQSFIIRSKNVYSYPVAIQDSNKVIPIDKKVEAGLHYYFSSVVALDQDATLSIINLNLDPVISRHSLEYKFYDFTYDTRLKTYRITAAPTNEKYEHLAPKAIYTDYYYTKVVRRAGTNVHDIYFFFNPFTGNKPLEIIPNFSLLYFAINLGIDPKFSSSGFSFVSEPGFIKDTCKVYPAGYSYRFIVEARGENRFLTPVIKGSYGNARLVLDSSSVVVNPEPGEEEERIVRYYYTLTGGAGDVDITVTADPCTYAYLPMNPQGIQYIAPKAGEGFYVDTVSLREGLLDIYVRTDSRVKPKAFLLSIEGKVTELERLSEGNYKVWQINFQTSNFPNFSGEYPFTLLIDNICLIYPYLPPEIFYVKKDQTGNAFVIDYDKQGPRFLVKVDNTYDKDTFDIFLGRPYNNLLPKVDLKPIPDNSLLSTGKVRGIDTMVTSVKLNETGTNRREGTRFRYEVTTHESALLRIALPPYHAVTLPEELPQGLKYGSSVVSGSTFYGEGQDVSFLFSVQKDYAVRRPVVKFDDGTILTVSGQTADGTGNLNYKVSFRMPDHDVSLIFATEYHSLTFPATALPEPLEYVEGFKGAVGETYYYPPGTSAQDTITLFVKGNEPPPSVSILDNPFPNAVTFYPEQPPVSKEGGTIYRYPVRFSGHRNLFISRASVFQDTVILPSLSEEGLKYVNGSEEGQVFAKPGELVTFSVCPTGIYFRACPLVTLNGRTLAPVFSDVPVTKDSTVYTYSFIVPAIPSAGRNPVKIQPEIKLDHFTVEFTNPPLPAGINFHESSNLRGSKNYLYRAFGHDFRDTFVLVVDHFYADVPPEISIKFAEDGLSQKLLPDAILPELPGVTPSGTLYRFIVNLPYDNLHAFVSIDFSPVTHVWPPLPAGIVYETRPSGLTSDGGVSCYSKGQEVSFTLRTLSPYDNVAPIVHRNGRFVNRTYIGAGKYGYSFTAEEDANLSFFLPYRVITLPALGEGLHYVGLPGKGSYYVSPNSDIPFRFTLAVDETHAGASLPSVLVNGGDLKPESVNGGNFAYSLRTSLDASPFISLTSLALNLTLPPLPQGLAYDDGDVPGESQHVRTINKTFTILVEPQYRAIKPRVSANGTILEPVYANSDGSSYTYTVNADVNTFVSVAFDYYFITLPPNLPAGVSYTFGSLEAGTYIRAAGDVVSFSLHTSDDNDDEPPTVYCNGAFVPAEQRQSGVFEYTFTVVGNTTALISFNNLVLFIGIEAPELSIVSDKGPGIHYYPVTGIHEIFILELDPEYAGLTPVLTVNGIPQAATYVQGNRFTYNLNSGTTLEVHATLRYNTFILEQVPPPYLFLLPVADTYYRDAGVPFQFRVQDYLNLGDPSVTFSGGQSLAPVSHEGNEYTYALNPGGGTNVYSIRVASKLSDPLLPAFNDRVPFINYHSAALHLDNLAGRKLILVDAAGRLVLRILPSSDSYVYPISLSSGIYLLISPSYQGAQPVAHKFIVR
jgi:hypothetical protein